MMKSPHPSVTQQQYIFGSLFLLSNKLQVIGDQFLVQDGMTIRQWFLTVMILQFDQDPGPTLGEVARLMETSHQNVKQLALKLQEKGFLTIEKDAQDGRAIRLQLTEKSREYWKAKEPVQDLFLQKLFAGITPDEITSTCETFQKLFHNMDGWNNPLEK
ncbi:MarR family winged helix-turn-helix transcriptional regulator [Anoxynatronum sibiricum]|uniref:MarR family transcriptional regulator n=1 Tax=Anoxynatronum sibiricum TaxID=210623 RepID=A0ABU9VW22_9CLOT